MRTTPLVCCCVLFAACDGGGDRAAVDAVTNGNGGAVANAWLPLWPGSAWIYTGEVDGLPLDELVRVQPIEFVPGVGDCTPVLQLRSVDGVLIEQTIEWFLLDGAGDVWRAGERSWELQQGEWRPTPDSWRADELGGVTFLHLPAAAMTGDRFSIELPSGAETFLIVDDRARTVVPAGAFLDCLQVVENPDTPDQDLILYAAGTGMVEERWPGGHKVLIEYQRPR